MSAFSYRKGESFQENLSYVKGSVRKYKLKYLLQPKRKAFKVDFSLSEN
jgi:hypothetical protein